MNIPVSAELKGMGGHLETAMLEGIDVGDTTEEVFRALESEVRTELSSRFPTKDRIKDDRVVRAYRDLYWRIGIDPTKQRPSSEALVRRVLKRGLPMINQLVDAGNLASARALIPIGIYDMGRVEGGLTLRGAREGELFEGIGGISIGLNEGAPVLADEKGPIHLFPYRDSTRTMITKRCEKALIVACGVVGVKGRLLHSAVEQTAVYFEELGGIP